MNCRYNTRTRQGSYTEQRSLNTDYVVSSFESRDAIIKRHLMCFREEHLIEKFSLID